MSEEKGPELPKILEYEEKKEELASDEEKEIIPHPPEDIKEQTKTEEQTKKRGEKLQQTFSDFKFGVEKTVNIKLYRPQIEKRIEKILKKGNTLIIGRNIGEFAERLVNKGYTVIARDTSPTYISPKTEVNNTKVLEKLDLKPFVLEKLKNLDERFINIIILFALKGQTYDKNYELLEECKRKLFAEGQIFLSDEFVPKKNILFGLLKLITFGIKTIVAKIRKREVINPFLKVDKMIQELQFRKYKEIEDAGGRIRTYIIAKRLSAFLKTPF